MGGCSNRVRILKLFLVNFCFFIPYKNNPAFHAQNLTEIFLSVFSLKFKILGLNKSLGELFLLLFFFNIFQSTLTLFVIEIDSIFLFDNE